VLTLSIIKADTGGWVGHSAVHPDMVEVARQAIDGVRGRLLVDGQVATCDDDLSLIMTHDHGPDAEAVHRFGSLEPWSQARSYLAGEVVDRAHRNGPLGKVQVRVLVPLESDLASRPKVDWWRPGEWVTAVLASLAPLAEWQRTPRRS